ncbi:MAG: hypothetical protein SVM79_03375 [Chloroflexota bacterium]|nr:hypothetical protein [Chloroflexota bacterium]
MSTQAAQDLVKKIFGDIETKRLFLVNPNDVLAGYDLTTEEKQAALNVHASLGLVSGDSPQLEAVLKPAIQWVGK